MEQKGYVIEVRGSTARVRVDRESACGGNCVSCKGCPSEAVIVTAENTMDLRRGDIVTLYEDTKKVITYAFIGYGLMALLLVAGAVIGFMLTGRDIFAVAGAAAALAIGFIILKLFFKNVKTEFKITDVIKCEADSEEYK